MFYTWLAEALLHGVFILGPKLRDSPNPEHATCTKDGEMKELHSSYSSCIISLHISLDEASHMAKPDIDQIGSMNLTDYSSLLRDKPNKGGTVNTMYIGSIFIHGFIYILVLF